MICYLDDNIYILHFCALYRIIMHSDHYFHSVELIELTSLQKQCYIDVISNKCSIICKEMMRHHAHSMYSKEQVVIVTVSSQSFWA